MGVVGGAGEGGGEGGRWWDKPRDEVPQSVGASAPED